LLSPTILFKCVLHLWHTLRAYVQQPCLWNAGVSGIYLFTYFLAVLLPLLKRLDGRTGRSLQPGLNNLLTLNLIVCRKRQLNLKRISLLKRKAQHRRKRLQRKKHAKFKRKEPGSQHRDSFFPATFGFTVRMPLLCVPASGGTSVANN